MSKTRKSAESRLRRKAHISKKMKRSSERPRLTVFRSANHIYAQVIDDIQGRTLASASTLSPELRNAEGHAGNVGSAKRVGALIAQKAQAAGISRVVFDRNGFLYHGRVKALADAAREAGLEF
jgi:large subunit ribosomal protein L18